MQKVPENTFKIFGHFLTRLTNWKGRDWGKKRSGFRGQRQLLAENQEEGKV